MEQTSEFVAPSSITRIAETIRIRHQRFLDLAIPHVTLRWVVLAICFVLYAIRTYYLQGWYIVTYILGIHLLSMFVEFLSPRIEPGSELDVATQSGQLPTKSDQEFKPFIRRLPEFKFWVSAERAVFIAFLCTFFDGFNIPVFWPILVLYFCVLFGTTMYERIKHMRSHNYVPFDIGKPRHKGKEDTGKVVAPATR